MKYLCVLATVFAALALADVHTWQARADQEITKARAGQWQALGVWRVTAFCPCFRCCGKHPDDPLYGISADGTRLTDWTSPPQAVAAPPSVAFGATLYVEGIGPCVVHDRGGAIKGQRLDVYFQTHGEALEFGVKKLGVWRLIR